jgi:hypothetical protein
LICIIILGDRQYQIVQEQIKRDIKQTTCALVQMVDGQLLQAEVLAQTLATVDFLFRQDIASFHQLAQTLLQRTGIAQSIVLYDVRGQKLVNTRLHFGQPLPRRFNLAQIERVFATGKPATPTRICSAIWSIVALLSYISRWISKPCRHASKTWSAGRVTASLRHQFWIGPNEYTY